MWLNIASYICLHRLNPQNLNSMKNLLSILITSGFIICLLHVGYSQGANEQTYLRKVGMLDSIYSEVLGESRQFYVQMPDNYNPSDNQKYPVAYILDGEVFLPTVHDVQNYYSGGYTPEMVLIGIVNDKNRLRDLTISPIDSKYGMPFTERNGEADNFRKFMEQELIPFIEANYPVSSYRTLIGHSYGGLFTISTLIHRPDLFSNYLAIDPSLDWDDQKLLKESKDILATGKLRNKALFISLSGQLHMQNADITIENVMDDNSDYTLFPRSNIAFSNLVRQEMKNGLRFNWKFYPSDIHGTVPFPSIMDGMISLFTWYQMEDTDKINSFDTPKDTLFAIVKNREMKLKKNFGYRVAPYPEDLLNMSGYMNMDMEQVDKAKMYFELAIEYFPESANAYDSMAEYYETQNQIDKAIKFAQKAAELNDDAYYKNRLEALKNK